MQGWLIGSQIFIALLVAAVGWYFAHQQTKIAKAKLRLDLFDKRFAVFNATRSLMGAATAHGNVTNEEELAFLVGTIDTEILFDDELAAYITEIRRHVGVLQAHNAMAKGPEVGKAEIGRLKEVQWFSAQIDALSEKFKPFLKLDG